MSLIYKLENLKKLDIKGLVDNRIKEFKLIKKEQLFSELCFCLLTANFNAEKSIKIQKRLEPYLQDLDKTQLAVKLKEYGHRFTNKRAEYICLARAHKGGLDKRIKEKAVRVWLVENIKGLGLKEASHFLRNIGFDDYAIIDFHIVDLLVKENLIERPKTITPKIYLEIENVLKKLAIQVSLTLAELDLYLWYLETGKILK